jgi:uncharacterized membrane protein
MSVTVENRRNRLRSAVAAMLAVLLLVPVGILFAQVWDSTEDERDRTRTERQGVEYLTRLGPLLTALVEAQGAALQGQAAPPPSLPAAVAGVAEVDSRLGRALGTSERWKGLQTKIDGLQGAASRGPLPGFQAHVEAADLLTALYGAVRDSSGLGRDPDNDLANLQRAITADLPETTNQSARIADLSLLVANAAPKEQRLLAPQLGATVISTDTGVNRLTDSLQAAVTDTGSGTLSSNLLATVDGIRQGIEGLVRVATTTGKLDVTALGAARVEMQKATAGLSGTVLTEMDGLLQARLDQLDDRRLRALLTASAAVLLALLAIVVPLLGRRRGAPPVGTGVSQQDRGRPGSAVASIFGDNPYDPEPYGDGVPPTRRERSGVLR